MAALVTDEDKPIIEAMINGMTTILRAFKKIVPKNLISINIPLRK